MKRFMILSVLLVFISYCHAQEKKVDAPAAAITAFAAKFPQAKKIKWSLEKEGEYEAEFVLGKTETSAVFDAKGNLLETEIEIKESELPQAVKDTLTKDFAGYKLNEIEKADIKGVINYEMEAKKKWQEVRNCFRCQWQTFKERRCQKRKS